MTPAEGLKSLHFSDDFEAVLFAAEPDVMDPVDMAFDEYGPPIAEMRGLPDDPPPGKPRGATPAARTPIVTRADKARVCREHRYLRRTLSMEWRADRAIAGILYFKDTNGDGNRRSRVWFTGFFLGSKGRSRIHAWTGRLVYFSNVGAGDLSNLKHRTIRRCRCAAAVTALPPAERHLEVTSGATSTAQRSMLGQPVHRPEHRAPSPRCVAALIPRAGADARNRGT
jgi:hypothetical protein